MISKSENKPRKIAFVIGGASCVWRDWHRARALCQPHMLVLINDIGINYPEPFDVWVSYHQNLLVDWIEKRRKRGKPPAKKVYVSTGRCKRGVKGAKTIKVRGGSSGLLATHAALTEGASHVILTGVPMDPQQGHVLNNYKVDAWLDGKKYLTHWQRDYKILRSKVRSMSGFTKELLGEPTIDWLEKFHD